MKSHKKRKMTCYQMVCGNIPVVKRKKSMYIPSMSRGLNVHFQYAGYVLCRNTLTNKVRKPTNLITEIDTSATQKSLEQSSEEQLGRGPPF
jgi:hypothetical protein